MGKSLVSCFFLRHSVQLETWRQFFMTDNNFSITGNQISISSESEPFLQIEFELIWDLILNHSQSWWIKIGTYLQLNQPECHTGILHDFQCTVNCCPAWKSATVSATAFAYEQNVLISVNTVWGSKMEHPECHKGKQDECSQRTNCWTDSNIKGRMASMTNSPMDHIGPHPTSCEWLWSTQDVMCLCDITHHHNLLKLHTALMALLQWSRPSLNYRW